MNGHGGGRRLGASLLRARAAVLLAFCGCVWVASSASYQCALAELANATSSDVIAGAAYATRDEALAACCARRDCGYVDQELLPMRRNYNLYTVDAELKNSTKYSLVPLTRDRAGTACLFPNRPFAWP